VQVEVPGIDLGRASAHERERAIPELAGALAAVHATPCDGIHDDIRPLHPLPLAPLLELIERIRSEGGAREVLDATEAFVCATWDPSDECDVGLAHGDPHLENVLWDGEHVSAVLDLEWIHADLEILASVSDPALFASADYEHEVLAADYAKVPQWLAAAQPGWFSQPRLVDRLKLLHVSRTLGFAEDGPLPERRWHDLCDVLDGTSAIRRQLGFIGA